MSNSTLLIRGGRLLAPADGYHGSFSDLLIENGKIRQIAEKIPVPVSADVLSLDGEYVSPGFIDSHGHFDPDNSIGIGLHRDLAGVLMGNSTVIDAGTTGAYNFPDFRKRWFDIGNTRIYTLLNLAKMGIDTWQEASDLTNFDLERIRKVVEENRDCIVGLKIRSDREAVGKLGLYPFQLAQKLSKELKIPLVTHVGEAPPEINEILSALEGGNVLTHCFNLYQPNGIWNSLVTESFEIRQEVWSAKKRGVLFDVGHGGCSFSFTIARTMMEQRFYPDMISTDIYSWNYRHPVRGLWNVMSKMLLLGMPLEQCVMAVTSTPADTFLLKNLGHLCEGSWGDVSVFKLDESPIDLTDSCGENRTSRLWIHPKYTVVAGNVFHAL